MSHNENGGKKVDQKALTRRQFLQMAGGTGAGVLAAACAPQIVEVEKEVPVEVEVEKIVEVQVGTKTVKMWMLPNFNPLIDLHLIKAGTAAGDELGIDVLVEPTQTSGWQENVARLTAAHEAGTAADIICPQLGSVAFMEQGICQPIPDVFDQVGADGGGWTDVVMNNFTLDGKGYYLNIGHAPAYLHIREDLVNEAGYSLPFSSLDELKECAAAINDPANGVYGTGMAYAEADDLMHLNPLLWCFGGACWDEDSNPTLTRPENVEALTWYVSIYQDGLSPEASVSWGGGGNNQAYLSGQAAIVMNPGSILAAVRRGDHSVDDLLEKTAVGPWPAAGPAGPQCMTEAGQAYGVWSGSSLLDESKKVLSHMWGLESYIELQRMGQSYLFPALYGAYEDEFFSDDKQNQEILANVIPIMKDESWPSPPKSYTSLWSTWAGPACLRVIVDGWTPEDALAEAQETVEGVKAEYA